jgi:mono/diheme cytochrome c family protein
MQYAKRVFPLLPVVLFFSLVLPSIASAAGDPVAGKTLYNTAYSGLSCGTSGCHGGYTGANNPNKITNGANNPTLIQSAINGNTGGMGVFKNAFTATDLANIAAYIATPNAGSGSPAVSLAPASLAFASQAINTSSTQSVTLTNSGTAA